MVCVHGTGRLLASSPRQAYPGLFCVSSPESISLTSNQSILPLQATWVSPLFSPSLQCPAHSSWLCVHISWAMQDNEAVWASFWALDLAQGTDVCSTSIGHRRHPPLPNKPTIQQPASKRKTFQNCSDFILQLQRSKAIPRWGCESTTPVSWATNGVLVFMQRKVVWTRERKYWLDCLVTLSIQAGMLVTKETIKVKEKPPPAEGPHTWVKAETLRFLSLLWLH